MDALSKPQSSAGADRRSVGHLAQAVPLIAGSTMCSTLADQFAQNPGLPAYVIQLDQGGYALVDRSTFMPQYLFGYNRELHQRTPISRFNRARTLVVSEETQTGQVGLLLTGEYPELLTSGFVITRRGEYIGIGLSIDLMRAIAELAEEANAAKTTFLSNMNHEIRTPLSSVIGNLELLALGNLDNEQREIVRMAKISADVLLELVGDLLDLSKLQAGHLQLELVETDIRQLVDEVLTIVAPRARQKGLRLMARVGASAPARFTTDPFRLRQVLVNLLGNAAKFTQSGGAFLTVRKAVTGPEGGRLRFEILDTGPGFDPAKAEELFRPFVQEDASTTRRFGGTGLGLSISKGIVEKLGGKIGCAAEPGLGATFWCELPTSEPAGANEARAADLANRAVLLLGDRDGRLTVERELRASGCPILSEDSLASGPTPRLSLAVLVSSQGAETSVLESVASLVALGVPIVVVSAQTSPAFDYQVHRAGADHILKIPEEAADVITILSAQARQPSSSAEPIAPKSAFGAGVAGRILVIDDTETNRVLATRQLQELGLAADTAADGQEGLNRAATETYAAILVDDSMPVMDGAEFMRRWRDFESDKGRPKTPLIAMTAHAQVGAAERYLAFGADDYLPKPVTLAKLGATLRRWLTPTPGHATPGPSELKDQAAASGTGEEAAVDLEALAELIGNSDPDALGELMLVFLGDFPELIAGVARAARHGGGAPLARAAHAAKSAAASACTKRLAAMLASIERSATNPADGELDRLLSEVQSEFARVEAELRSLLGHRLSVKAGPPTASRQDPIGPSQIAG